MNFTFGKSSTRRYHTLTHNMQWVMRESLAIGLMDFSIAFGYRGEQEQNEAYENGKSTKRWPYSKHNKMPSKAVDIYPYVNGKVSYNKLHCCVLAGIVLTTAAKLGIKIRWGGNWNQDGEPITDQEFNDLGHFEEV
jgi:peptidoglycan LD-endopeptidase CwlK